MAISLGAAYVDIVPSTANLAPQLKKQVGEPLAREGSSAGRTFGARFSAGMSSFVSGVGRMVSSAITTATAVAGAGLATALTTGWGRLTTIQDATSALTISLGDATKAADLLGNVLDVVTGTPFNLDQFAAAAQRMVGMGIEAQKIPTYLTAIGEASATQGGRANEFAERLSTIYGQVAAQGRLMGDDIRQISQTGVNALAILANHFGVTTDEMRKMVSDGAVPATEALDVLSEGILHGSEGIAGTTVALEGTMAALRETLSGAAGGFRAGLSQFGAKILEPFTEALVGGFNSAYDALGQLGDLAGSAAQSIAESDGFRSFVEWMADVPNKIGPAIDRLKELGPALAPIGGAVAAIGLGGLSSLPGLGFLSALNPVLGAIAAFIATTPELRTAVGEVATALGGAFSEVLSSLAEKLGPELPAISDALVDIGEAFADILIALTPVVPLLADVAILLIDKIGVPVLELIADAVSLIAEALLAMGPVLPYLVLLVGGLATLASIGKVLAPVLALLAKGIGLLMSPIGLVVGGIALLVGVVVLAYQNFEWFRNIVDGVGRFLRDTILPILGELAAFLVGPLTFAWEILWVIVETFWRNILQPLWSWISGTFLPILGRLANEFLGGVTRAFNNLKDAAQWVWNNVLVPLARFLGTTLRKAFEVVETVAGYVVGAFNTLASFTSAAFGGLKAAIDSLIGPLQALLTLADRAVATFGLLSGLTGAGGLAAGANLGPQDRSRRGRPAPGWGGSFHTGGVVGGCRGEEVYIRALGGETVLPTHDPSWKLELPVAPEADQRYDQPVNLVTQVVLDGSVVAESVRKYDRGLR